MSDWWALVVAGAAAAGALCARPVPVLLAVALVAVSLAVRRPWLLALAVALAASGLAARSWAGLSPPSTREVDGVVTLVGDPGNVSGALRVDVRVGRRGAEAWARGRAAARLRDRLASRGEARLAGL
jgi:hypothetical protein